MNAFDGDEDNNDGNGDKNNTDDELGGGRHT